MNLVIDTHTLLWFLTDEGKLGSKAQESLEKAERIYVPTIVLLELLYLLEKVSERAKFSTLLQKIENNNRYIIIAADMAIVNEVLRQKLKLEMHDRIIVATAKILNVPLITKDKVIKKLYKNTIW